MGNTLQEKKGAEASSSEAQHNSGGGNGLPAGMIHRKMKNRKARSGEVSEDKKVNELGLGGMEVNYGDKDLAKVQKQGLIEWVNNGKNSCHTAIEAVLATNLEERLKPATPDAKKEVLVFLFGQLGSKVVKTLFKVAELAELGEAEALIELTKTLAEQVEAKDKKEIDAHYMELINQAMTNVRAKIDDFFPKLTRHIIGLDDADTIALGNKIDRSVPMVKASHVAQEMVRGIEQAMIAHAGTVNEKLDLIHGVNDKMSAVTKTVEKMENGGKE